MGIDAALRLIRSHCDIIKVEQMDEGCALLLFGKKIRGGFDKQDATELLRALDYMPLVISQSQAAAYSRQRDSRTTVSKYLDIFCNSDRHRANPLSIDTGDPRRDSQASKSIITTWQISFEYTYLQQQAFGCSTIIVEEFILTDKGSPCF